MYLAGNVADDASEIGSERLQGPDGALELLGVGIALMLDQGELAHPGIGLPQREAALPAGPGSRAPGSTAAQVTAGDFANRPRAESTESTESFQPHFWEKSKFRASVLR
jgi:hypothetical protein